MPRPLDLFAGSILALSAASCVHQPITPGALAEAGPDGEIALAKYERAVGLANAFLASDARKMLPPGVLEWRGDDLVFVHAEGELPMDARRTTFGDVVVWFGFEAQERSDGFIVGARGDGDPRVFNTLFRSSFGGWKDDRWVAELILHELTHAYYGDGTVGLWSGFTYYLESIFLFRYRNHSQEARPYATTEEFMEWALTTPTAQPGA